ncbi:hypothetical protein IWW56_006425, partial [Coemansia sp. RSA 2131]
LTTCLCWPRLVWALRSTRSRVCSSRHGRGSTRKAWRISCTLWGTRKARRQSSSCWA